MWVVGRLSSSSARFDPSKVFGRTRREGKDLAGRHILLGKNIRVQHFLGRGVDDLRVEN